MPSLDELIKKLDALCNPKSWLGRILRPRRDEPILEILNQLGEIKGIFALNSILPLLFNNENLRAAARKKITQGLNSLSPIELSWLSEQFSNYHECAFDNRWKKVTVSEFEAIVGDLQDPAAIPILGIFSWHANGHIRQRAVQHLANYQNGNVIPYLIFRQNDWVDSIAVTAQTAVSELIQDQYALEFARSLPLVVRLDSRHRHNHRIIVHRVLDLLIKDQHQHLLKEQFESDDTLLIRYFLNYALSKPGSHRKRIITQGIESKDPLVRLACCRLLDEFPERELEVHLARMVNDHFMPVRRVAYELIIEHLPDQAVESLKRALHDKSRTIKTSASYDLKKHGLSADEIATLYREAINHSSNPLPSLQGLADNPTVQDLELFKELLHHKYPSRRVVGIRGLKSLKAELDLTETIRLLSDPSQQVVKEIGKSLRQSRQRIEPKALMNISLNGQGKYAQIHAISMIAELGKWESIPWLLSIASMPECGVADVAEKELIKWLTHPKSNRVAMTQSPSARDLILTTVKNAQGKISKQTLDLVEFSLGIPF